MITTPVPTVALLAAARAMNQPEPPADLGLYRAVRESQLPPAPSASGTGERGSQPPPSSRRPTTSAALVAEGQLLESEPFEFALSPRNDRFAGDRFAGDGGVASRNGENLRNSHAAPPLAEELGLDHLIADFKPQRSWSQWLRSYGVWIVAALLVLWLIVTFAARSLPV